MTTEAAAATSRYELDGTVVPLFYELKFTPDVETHILTACAVIHCQRVAEDASLPQTSVSFNTLALTFTARSVEIFAGAQKKEQVDDDARLDRVERIAVTRVETNTETEITTVFTSANLPQFFVMKINYTAPIGTNDSIPKYYGLYHFDPSVDNSYMATHLEPTHARRLYPCFDEPRFKAQFQVTVVIDEDLKVVSNTMMLSEDVITQTEREEDEGTPKKKVVVFEPTPKLCPFLVAFAIGKLHCLEAESKRGLLTRIFLPEYESCANGWYALDLLKKAVEFYEDLFGYELPMKKIDIVGLTEFGVLGMENWGMMCFAKDYLRVSETTPLERRQRIARLIGHEVGHQWFGNLVSLKAWKYLWLKEGFCRYLEFVFVQHCFPQWQFWAEFVTAILDDALAKDSDETFTHPVEMVVSHPRKIFDMFDVISYGKAAAIVRMLSTLIGDSTLAESLKLLIHNNAFGVISTDDFYDCIAKASKSKIPLPISVKDFVHQWVSTEGHPFIYVSELEDGFSVRQFRAKDYTVGALRTLINKPGAGIHLRSLSVTSSGDSPMPSGPLASLSPPYTTTQHHKGSKHFKTVVQLDYTEWMEPSHFIVPVKVVTVLEGKTSITSSIVLRESCTEHQSQHLSFFNSQCAGVFRVDYEPALWTKIFEISSFLNGVDRLGITATLFGLRNYHIGACTSVVAQKDSATKHDRCVILLRWLLHLADAQETNAHVIRFLTEQLEMFLILLRERTSCELFAKVVESLFAHLVASKTVSFFSTENRVDYKASQELSSKVVDGVLNCLALTQSQLIVKEAKTFADKVLAPWFPMSADAGENAAGAQSFDLENPSVVNRARISIQLLVEQGEIELISKVILMDALLLGHQKTADEMASELGVLGFPISMPVQPAGLTPSQLSSWKSIIHACALTIPEASLYPILAQLFFKGFLNGSTLKSLFRNSTLLLRILDTELSSSAMNYFHKYAAKYCASPILFAALFDPKPSQSPTAETPPMTPRDSEELLKLKSQMEENCLWAQHVDDHYVSFLSSHGPGGRKASRGPHSGGTGGMLGEEGSLVMDTSAGHAGSGSVSI